MSGYNQILKYSKNIKVIYVEDDENSRELMGYLLKDFFDNLVICKDGQDALEKFDEGRYDLLITDINMPRMDGIELIKRVRERDKEIFIIMLSAYNEEEYFLHSIKYGVDGYLIKPINIEDFIETIERIVTKYRYKVKSNRYLKILKEYQEAMDMSNIVSMTDIDGVITYANEKFCKISGFSLDELVGKKHNIIRHPDNPTKIYENLWKTIKEKKKVWKGVLKNRSKSGRSYYTDSVIKPILDENGEILEFLSIRHDITKILDPLKQLKHAIKYGDYAIVYMKLDEYEILESFYDEKFLKEIEQESAKYLEFKFKDMLADSIFELGEGEFAVIVKRDSIKDRDEFIETIKLIQQEIKNKILSLKEFDYDISVIISVVIDGKNRVESAKIGIKQILINNNFNNSNLISNFIIADNFYEKAKNEATNNFKTIKMIKSALNDSRIISYFQPIVDNKTKRVVKYESLVRLIDEDGNVVSPFFFLDISKKGSYYTNISNRILEYSFDFLNRSNFDVSINISSLDIEQDSVSQKINELLSKNIDRAKRVTFELLEDENIKNMKRVEEFIDMVKSFGVKIAIDDFGSGYSNFERLLNFKPDILKIDGSLIKNIDKSNFSLSVVKSIVTFAKEQKIETVAEFIENEEIFNIVKDLGIDYSQGYYFGKPETMSKILG